MIKIGEGIRDHVKLGQKLTETAGPIAGLLFMSNNRIAFCSERSIKVTSPSGKLLKVHYKVMIPLGKNKQSCRNRKCEKNDTEVRETSDRG
ncbi:hypothetical protein CASFOL_020380 [Castilleja foliolosa]|uniref:GRAM domain-containing protein n=1 Tax=Castilleja foliolosa TaxID=1961234 RepID=A0ABD3D0P3_9LAMI